MTRIIHISDLHFGTEKPELVTLVENDIHNLNPDLIVASGDFTQRALVTQFQTTQQFLKRLGVKVLCVPGNHDISLYNFIRRFFFTFRRYHRYITSETYPSYINNNVAILGISSVTPYKPMGGYVTDAQLKYVTDFFQKQPMEKVKIIVMHHNLVRSERHKIINDSEKIINIFGSCRVNLILSGHLHQAHIEQTKRESFTQNMYVITAGTAISTRTIAPNSFNVIDIEDNKFTYMVREYKDREFIFSSNKSFDF